MQNNLYNEPSSKRDADQLTHAWSAMSVKDNLNQSILAESAISSRQQDTFYVLLQDAFGTTKYWLTLTPISAFGSQHISGHTRGKKQHVSSSSSSDESRKNMTGLKVCPC
ncbi:hypothetical protein EXN66_Car020483 [Channa argus]|uniref:Uncharacterized protein n=1 Tax=Channa argus TaxID=215402 RepID=A0A6G1QR71_CHAAH|nr:hypothetical protein EXN66_Car020483 [Channa argus]